MTERVTTLHSKFLIDTLVDNYAGSIVLLCWFTPTYLYVWHIAVSSILPCWQVRLQILT